MSVVDDLRREISAEIETLGRRFRTSTDEAEKRTVADVVAALEAEIGLLNQATLLDAANSLATVTAQLERAVGAARLGPFDGYLAALERHFERLNRLSGKIHGHESLAPAAARPVRGRGKKTGRKRRGRREAPRDFESAGRVPINSKVFVDLADEYRSYYDECVVRAAMQPNVDYYLKRLRRGQPSYEQVAGAMGMPWPFVGVVHAMECGFNFSAHLHNGDPLTARTTHVPKGCPKSGSPPYTWFDSALDALKLRKLDQIADWSVAHMLYLLEGYNGFGYRRLGVPTPYLWSFSNIYEKGKFVQDGKFDANTVSKQCGAALMLKALMSP
jgi:lysozyme family protein